MMSQAGEVIKEQATQGPKAVMRDSGFLLKALESHGSVLFKITKSSKHSEKYREQTQRTVLCLPS